MATNLYDLARQAFAEGNVDWVSDDVRAILIDTAEYTVNLATDEFLEDIPSAARIAVSGALQNKTATNGVLDADDITISSVSGATVEAIAYYIHTGNEATARLLIYSSSGTGLPFTPHDGNVQLQFDNGANKIIKI